jgi:hypothetical protein
MASWMNKFYIDDVQWKLPQWFYFNTEQFSHHASEALLLDDECLKYIIKNYKNYLHFF